MAKYEEKVLKDFARQKVCPDCFSRMKNNNPELQDCPFRYNDQEHACDLVVSAYEVFHLCK